MLGLLVVAFFAGYWTGIKAPRKGAAVCAACQKPAHLLLAPNGLPYCSVRCACIKAAALSVSPKPPISPAQAFPNRGRPLPF